MRRPQPLATFTQIIFDCLSPFSCGSNVLISMPKLSFSINPAFCAGLLAHAGRGRDRSPASAASCLLLPCRFRLYVPVRAPDALLTSINTRHQQPRSLRLQPLRETSSAAAWCQYLCSRWGFGFGALQQPLNVSLRADRPAAFSASVPARIRPALRRFSRTHTLHRGRCTCAVTSASRAYVLLYSSLPAAPACAAAISSSSISS